MLGFERLAGFRSTTIKSDNGRGETESRTYSYVGVGVTGVGGEPYDVARFAVDGFITGELSLGGAIGFASLGDEYDATIFVIEPRIGYGLGLGQRAAFWPRAGLTYRSLSSHDRDHHGVGLSLEAMFVLSPSDHWGFAVGPTFDFDLTGTYEYEQLGSRDEKFRSVGLAVGLVGWP